MGGWICCVLSEEVSFEISPSTWLYVKENEQKNIVKNQKFKILKKYVVYIWWTCSFPPNMELIRLRNSEEMDDGRRTDNSGSAVQ